MLLPRPSVSRPLVTALVAFLLALHAWLAVTATIDLGVTADETAHLTAGYAYWRFDDYRLQPENGNLPQRWAALPLLALEPRLEPAEQADAWRRSHVWLIGQRFFFESGNPIEFILLCARSTAIGWSVATGLLVFCWSRRLWGDTGALLSLALQAFSPTLLAHGPLVTSDVCAAFWLLAAAGAWWRLLQRCDRARLGVSVLTAAGAAVAKFSCVLLLPVAVLLALWRVLQPAPWPIALRSAKPAAQLGGRARQLGAIALLGAAHVLVAAAVVWACFGFRYSAFAPGLPEGMKFFAAWDGIVPSDGFWKWFFDFAREWRLLPEAYLQGFAYVLSAAQERGAFLAGEFSTTGWWWFFPYAFLVKSSLAELAALAGVAATGAWALARHGVARIGKTATRVAPLPVFAAVFGGFALASDLNIGQRHILPLYPVLFILAGAIARPAAGSTGRAAALALAALAGGEAIAARPHYLAYFNRLAGGPEAGWRHLADSSLDWGQNLPRLATWLQAHRQPGEPVYVSIFGTDDPFYHGIKAEELSPIYSFGRARRWVELEPGLYCVSATMLQDVYSPYAGPWTVEREVNYRRLLRMMRAELASGTRTTELGEFGEGPGHLMWNLDRARFARLCFYLRERRPDASIGHSIFVFRLSAEEIRVTVDGTLTELAEAMNVQAKSRASPAQGN